MQSLLSKPVHQKDADSFGVPAHHLSLWFPTRQFHRSLPNSDDNTKAEYHHNYVNQEQDSSSTLSTGQSDLEAATSDYLSHHVQMEHHNQAPDCVSYPFAGSCFGRTYDPNAVVHPYMMGMAPRAVLPLDCTESLFPIYVNAKQYHAILRRRQTRAKLEARNKMTKSRKPYLHESRHLHALKRVRGSGGRFLNTKNVEERELSLDKKLVSENNSWGGPTTSESDVSCVFNSDDIFVQPDLGISTDSLTGPDNRLPLSIDGYGQFGTAT